MAAAGIDSRRQCEELILAGRVEIDRQVVKELGATVDLDSQEVRVDGEILKLRARREYFLVNKPRGVVCTNDDPDGRTRIIDLLPKLRERLFTVGRLDMESEGLILLTNDGELAHRLAHPRFGVQKVYHVVVAGVPSREELEQLTKGVRLAESWVKAERATIKSEHKQSATIEIVLREGKNREIRRLLARIGHKVMRLKRVQIGGVKLKDLEPGEWRRLRTEEVSWLRTSTYGDREEASDDRERRPPRRSDGPRPEGRPPRSRSEESTGRPARPPRDAQRRADDTARPPRPRPLPTTAGPNLAKGMMADEPGTIKPLPRARKPGKRHKRRVLIGTSLRKKKRS
jgi:23S rRNA pseudouridine2605 synthase